MLPDAILTCRVKIGEIGSAEIFALGVLPMMLLTICFHFVDVFLGVLSYAWIIPVGADDNMLPILELGPSVGAAAAMTCKQTSSPATTRGGIGGAIGGQTAARGIMLHCQLGLTGVSSNDGSSLSPAGGRGGVEGLRKANGLA